MDTRLQKLIANTVRASRLSGDESRELEQELRAHVKDTERDLLFSGVKPDEITEHILEEFGDPDTIGRQLFIVHRRLEGIPWIGPFFYYGPLRGAVRFFMGHVFSVTAILLCAPFVHTVTADATQDFNFSRYIVLICFLFPLSYLWAVYWSITQLKKWNRIIEALILSFIPPVLVAGLYWLSIWLHSVPWFTSDIQSMETTTPWWLPFGLLMAVQLVAIALDTIIVYALQRVRKRQK